MKPRFKLHVNVKTMGQGQINLQISSTCNCNVYYNLSSILGAEVFLRFGANTKLQSSVASVDLHLLQLFANVKK